jgi:hypothetical protein
VVGSAPSGIYDGAQALEVQALCYLHGPAWRRIGGFIPILNPLFLVVNIFNNLAKLYILYEPFPADWGHCEDVIAFTVRRSVVT